MKLLTMGFFAGMIAIILGSVWANAIIGGIPDRYQLALGVTAAIFFGLTVVCVALWDISNEEVPRG